MRKWMCAVICQSIRRRNSYEDSLSQKFGGLIQENFKLVMVHPVARLWGSCQNRNFDCVISS
jgi:hypothetical protein